MDILIANIKQKEQCNTTRRMYIKWEMAVRVGVGAPFKC